MIQCTFRALFRCLANRSIALWTCTKTQKPGQNHKKMIFPKCPDIRVDLVTLLIFILTSLKEVIFILICLLRATICPVQCSCRALIVHNNLANVVNIYTKEPDPPVVLPACKDHTQHCLPGFLFCFCYTLSLLGTLPQLFPSYWASLQLTYMKGRNLL